MDRGEHHARFVGVLDRDYQSARNLMTSANGSIDRTRTFGFALVAALIGFTAANHTLWFGLLATLASGLLAYLDGIQSWRYEEASRHALRIERIQQLLYRAEVGIFNERDEKALNIKVYAFRPGVLTGQGRFTPRDLLYTLPRPILILYLLLAFAGAAIGTYESTTGSTTTVNARILSSAQMDERRSNKLEDAALHSLRAAQKVSPDSRTEDDLPCAAPCRSPSGRRP